jgi:hypothetical protein
MEQITEKAWAELRTVYFYGPDGKAFGPLWQRQMAKITFWRANRALSGLRLRVV